MSKPAPLTAAQDLADAKYLRRCESGKREWRFANALHGALQSKGLIEHATVAGPTLFARGQRTETLRDVVQLTAKGRALLAC